MKNKMKYLTSLVLSCLSLFSGISAHNEDVQIGLSLNDETRETIDKETNLADDVQKESYGDRLGEEDDQSEKEIYVTRILKHKKNSKKKNILPWAIPGTIFGLIAATYGICHCVNKKQKSNENNKLPVVEVPTASSKTNPNILNNILNTSDDNKQKPIESPIEPIKPAETNQNKIIALPEYKGQTEYEGQTKFSKKFLECLNCLWDMAEKLNGNPGNTALPEFIDLHEYDTGISWEVFNKFCKVKSELFVPLCDVIKDVEMYTNKFKCNDFTTKKKLGDAQFEINYSGFSEHTSDNTTAMLREQGWGRMTMHGSYTVSDNNVISIVVIGEGPYFDVCLTAHDSDNKDHTFFEASLDMRDFLKN